MIEVHLRKLRARAEINAEEERTIGALVSEIVEYPADRTVIRHGREVSQSTMLLEGWMARVKDLPDGQRRSLKSASLATFQICTASRSSGSTTTSSRINVPAELRVPFDPLPLAP